MKCREKAEWYTQEELLNIIRNSARKLKRVPARRELRGVDNAYKRFFGSWNNAVIAAGLLPNRSHNQQMYKCARTKALDGHLCDSVSELIIDNWLTKNKLKHKRNIPYPKTNHKADWGIDLKGRTIFIEYFGLAKDSPRYDRTVERKKDICRKYKIKLISIYPKDVYPLKDINDTLRKKFKDLLDI